MIELSHSEIGKCLDFSYEVTKRTEKYYKKRNIWARTEKLIFDHAIGKMSELATYKYFDNLGYRISYPDFDLEFKSDKNIDLTIFKDDQIMNLHIKSVRHDSPVTDSWLIETKEIEHLKENDYFVFTKFYSPTKIQILKIIKHSDIVWKKPRLESLKSKSACYLSDM